MCPIVIMDSTMRSGQPPGCWDLRSRLCRAGSTRVPCPDGAHHDRDVNAAVNLQRLATGAHAARTALPEASQAVTPGTAAGDGAAGGGKVTPVRHEHGQQDGSGQEEFGEHLCEPSR